MSQQVLDRRRAADLPTADAQASTAAQSRPADPAPGPAVAAPDAEFRAVLEPMLAAVMRLAGADAATLRVGCEDAPRLEPAVTVGRNVAFDDHGDALPSWCHDCDESRRADSACVKSELCGHDERIPAGALGLVCKHIVTVPLRHKDRPVGVLNLLFAAECALPPSMTPLLQATGDLIGVTLDNARLARENLRIRLGAERQMLASEVHDSLAQGLTYMRMRMSLLRDAIRRGDEPGALKYWGDVDDTLGNSHRRLRELITYFRSQMDPRGLVHALREVSEVFPDRTGIALAFADRAPELCVAPEREIEVFHIVQEALANVARHAHASRASLVLDRRGGEYVIAVEDDGVGIAADHRALDADASGHYGLSIMRERARRLGGRLVVADAAGGGTRVELAFPVADPNLGTEA